MIDKPYDTSWDDDDGDIKAFEQKCKQWKSRNWIAWLKANLKFPFQAERMENDMDPFAPNDMRAKSPFPVGCKVEVLGIADDDCDVEFEGVIVEVKGKKRKGCLPLQDMEVRLKSDPNYWPVREFVVWYANR